MEHELFEYYITEAIAEVPERIRDKIVNIAFVVEDSVRAARATEHEINAHGMLLGLYQGIPLSKRSANYSGALPDKITIFKDAIEHAAGQNSENIRLLIRDVVHHEIAHYFGMGETEVRAREATKRHRRSRRLPTT